MHLGRSKFSYAARVCDEGLLGWKVMADQTSGGAHFGGHGTNGETADSAAGQDLPHGLGYVFSTGLVVTTRGHQQSGWLV